MGFIIPDHHHPRNAAAFHRIHEFDDEYPNGDIIEHNLTESELEQYLTDYAGYQQKHMGARPIWGRIQANAIAGTVKDQHNQITGIMFEIIDPKTISKIGLMKACNWLVGNAELMPWHTIVFPTCDGYGLCLPLAEPYRIDVCLEKPFTQLVQDTAVIIKKLATTSGFYIDPNTITPKYLHYMPYEPDSMESCTPPMLLDGSRRGFVIQGEKLRLPLNQ